MHTGYDTSTVDQGSGPDRPPGRDACSGERQRFKKLHDHYFVTTGTGAMPSKMEEIGAGIAEELAGSGVGA